MSQQLRACAYFRQSRNLKTRTFSSVTASADTWEHTRARAACTSFCLLTPSPPCMHPAISHKL
jgi:hypothetical protein